MAVLAVVLSGLISTVSAADRAENYGTGVSIMAMHGHTQGSHIDSDDTNGARLSYEYENRSVYGGVSGEYLLGHGNTDEWELRFEAGAGWRFFKAGIGLMQRGGQYNLSTTLGAGDNSFDATGFAVILRAHPIETRFVTVTVDGYAASFSSGKSTYYPEGGGLVQESVDFGDGYGYRATALFRFPANERTGIAIQYRADRMDIDSATINMSLAGTAQIESRRVGISFNWLTY